MNFLYVLEGIRVPFLDVVLSAATYLGQVIPLLLLLCAFYWCVDKEFGRRMGLSFFASGLVLQNLKIFCRIDRPWVLDPDFHPVESAVPGATGYSFPSGHSQSSASVWGHLAYLFRKEKRALLFVFFLLIVGFSRMYLGCHTPKDVFVGLLLGLLGIAFAEFLYDKMPDTKRGHFLLSLSFFVASVLSAVYAFHLLSNDVVSTANAKDAITIAGAGVGFSVGIYLERFYIRFSLPEGRKEKVTRFLAGLVLLLILKLLLGSLSGESLLLKTVEYALLLLFITAGYPALFTQFHNQMPHGKRKISA